MLNGLRENESVRKGEVVLAIESDKGVFEVQAEESGVLLKCLYPAGAEVEVLEPVAFIGQPGEPIPVNGEPALAKPELLSKEPRTDAKGPPQTDSQQTVESVSSSPAARRLAKEKGIDLRSIEGSGPQGRVIERDVLAALATQSDQREPQPASGHPLALNGGKVVPFDKMRQRVGPTSSA